ncbi:MAG: type II toxin-antitoxin system RelE/ParE family toxin, partial [Moorella sp. (in: Bacteria)]|nr:type II toxin-antitoxin system RelE/ParE family toxin [Moorella sp. (in: firmicutes)]
SVYLKASAEKDLRRLSPPLVARVLAAIEGLRSLPFPPDAVKLTGTQRLYRLRIGDYRIIYEVNVLTREVTVYYVRHRREAYRSLP